MGGLNPLQQEWNTVTDFQLGQLHQAMECSRFQITLGNQDRLKNLENHSYPEREIASRWRQQWNYTNLEHGRLPVSPKAAPCPRRVYTLPGQQCERQHFVQLCRRRLNKGVEKKEIE